VRNAWRSHARGRRRTPGDAVTAARDTSEPDLASRPDEPVSAPSPGASSWSRIQWSRIPALARHHWLITALVLVGLALRVLAKVAYQPALIYVDTLKYLYGVYPGSDPAGYQAVLNFLTPFRGLAGVAVVQGLLGLAMAVLLYAVLLRRGVVRWLAALAAAPVLLDAYHLQMEQMIMPDVWFEAMIVGGLALLLWRPVVSAPFAAWAGLIFGTSATLKTLGEVLILPGVVYLLAAGGAWRRAVAVTAAFAAAFALPIFVYCSVQAVSTGHFRLAVGQSDSGRLTAQADCAALKLPADVRPLCPTPSEQANGPDWLVHSAKSPLHAAPIPLGASRKQLIGKLDSAIEHQQPMRVAVGVARDALRLFALTRTGSPSVTPISRWQFQTRYPTYPNWTKLGRGNVIIVGLQFRTFGMFFFRPLKPSYGGPAQVDRPVAAFLRAYQLHGGYTPGPLLLLCALLGLAGSVLALARRARGTRSRQLALACLLMTATAVTVLLAPDVLEFSWRYQLPALITLVPAGALGIAALVSSWRTRKSSGNERVIEASDVAWVPGPTP
jgi:hypothetical protein